MDACIQVLDKARFNANGQLLTFSEEGISVLNHLNKFHMSWFTVRDFKDRPQTYTGQETLINDATEPGLFLTHLLFNSQNPPYSDAIKGSYSVRGIRSEGPYKAEEGKIISPYSFPLAALEYGKLRGVYKYAASFPSNPDTWYTGLGDPITSFPRQYTSPALPSFRSHGGGIIGSQSFLWMNGGFTDNSIRANGAERMPRKWVRALFTDLMCRDLPVLRTSDVSQPVIEYLAAFTDPATRIAFRSDTLCASCHETVDPGSSAIRNLRFDRVLGTAFDWDGDGSTADEGASMIFAGTSGLQATETTAFHLQHADTQYHNKKPRARLKYRSYDGSLINSDTAFFNNENIFDVLSKMGNFLANQNDLYVCAAARYFKFFTGISVNLSDPGDERNPPLSEADQYYKSLVVNLGQNLKSHQQLKELIRQILMSQIYQKSGMRDLAP